MDPKKFTLKYIEITSESLKMKEKDGKTICIVNDKTMADLYESLNTLIGSEGTSIIRKCKQRKLDAGKALLYGRDPSDNIKEFVEMSSLYMDEIYLKDIIFRIVKNRNNFHDINTAQTELENFSKQMYEIRPLAEMGFVKIIPHLTICDPEAIQFTKKYFPNQNFSEKELSMPYLYLKNKDIARKIIFWNALYSCSRLNCIPYTTDEKEWETTKSTLKNIPSNLEKIVKEMKLKKSEELKEIIELIEDHRTHMKCMELLRGLSGRLWYIRNTTAEDILKIRNGSTFKGFRRDLWELIDEIIESKGAEPKEIILNLEEQINSGVREIEKESNRVSPKIRKTTTAIEFLTGGIAASYGLYYAQASVIPLLVSIFAFGKGSLDLIADILEKEERNAVFVYFSRLKKTKV